MPNNDRELTKYDWADGQYNKSISFGTGFTQLLAQEPIYLGVEDRKKLEKRLDLIHEFQDICISIFRDALTSNDKNLIRWLLNETPKSLAIDFHKSLKDHHYTKPVFFRTDEMALGKIAEIQCPGSLWGELQLTYEFYKRQGYITPQFSPAEIFSRQLEQFLGEKPIIHYLIDNASAPAGVRYFIQKTGQYVSYFGIDKDIKAMSCNFVRTHSFYGLCGENYFLTRLSQPPGLFKYDYPPNIIFDQKATIVLPFWNKTKHLFSDAIRDLFLYSTPLLGDHVTLEDGSKWSLENFSKLPQGQRNYYIKYAGADVSINWGSRAVERLSNLGSGKCLERLEQCVSDAKNGRIWLFQKERTEQHEISYWNRDETQVKERMNTKFSCFYGPFGLIGIVPSFRKYFKVHGQPDTVISTILCV